MGLATSVNNAHIARKTMRANPMVTATSSISRRPLILTANNKKSQCCLLRSSCTDFAHVLICEMVQSAQNDQVDRWFYLQQFAGFVVAYSIIFWWHCVKLAEIEAELNRQPDDDDDAP